MADILEFWCDKCDCNLVKENDSSTGKFFRQFGHIVNSDNSIGDWCKIVWAVCNDCLKGQPTPKEFRRRKICLQLPVTVRSFSEAIHVPAKQVMEFLLVDLHTVASINAEINEFMESLSDKFGVEIELKQPIWEKTI